MCGSIRPYPLCPLAVLPSLRSSSGSSTPSFFLCVSLHQSLNTVFSVGLLLVSPASRASLSPCEGQGPRGKRSRNAQVQLRTDLQLSARITFFTSVCVFFFKKNTFDNEGWLICFFLYCYLLLVARSEACIVNWKHSFFSDWRNREKEEKKKSLWCFVFPSGVILLTETVSVVLSNASHKLAGRFCSVRDIVFISVSDLSLCVCVEQEALLMISHDIPFRCWFKSGFPA